MKKAGSIFILSICMLSFSGCNNSPDPSSWSDEKLDKWFESGDFLKGWAVTPDASINRKQFARSYYQNQESWDKAFTFLRSTNLKAIEAKRYDIDGDNLYAIISDNITKNDEDIKFESHRKYIDIQYVIIGSEQIDVADVTRKGEVLSPYDESKDYELMTVTESTAYIATPDRFFIFFPSDLHHPGVKVTENPQVRKVVVKVKI